MLKLIEQMFYSIDFFNYAYLGYNNYDGKI